MKAVKRVAMICGSIIGWIVILSLTVFGLKGCVVSPWLSPRVPTTYFAGSSDASTMTVIFLPQNQTLIAYTNAVTRYAESVLTEMKGEYGTHCLGRLWRIEGPGIWFGYRVYPPRAKPVVMEIEILDKYISGSGDAVFTKIGRTTYSTILFYDNEVKFEEMHLVKKPTDTNYLEVLLSRLKRRSDHK